MDTNMDKIWTNAFSAQKRNSLISERVPVSLGKRDEIPLLLSVLHSNGHGDGSANHGVVAHRRLRLRKDADQSPQALDFTAFE